MFTFKRALPETEGVSSRAIMDTLKELDVKNVPMHSFLMMKNDALIFEKYYAPYDADRLHRMFSITKSFTAIAIALLAGEGRIGLDDPITDYGIRLDIAISIVLITLFVFSIKGAFKIREKNVITKSIKLVSFTSALLNLVFIEHLLL